MVFFILYDTEVSVIPKFITLNGSISRKLSVVNRRNSAVAVVYILNMTMYLANCLDIVHFDTAHKHYQNYFEQSLSLDDFVAKRLEYSDRHLAKSI